MALITKPVTLSNGTIAQATDVESNFTTIYNDYNGNITNANLSASAGIVDTKLDQIATASKVNGTSITNLAGITSVAGIVPAPNLGTGTTSGVRFLKSNGSWALSNTANGVIVADNAGYVPSNYLGSGTTSTGVYLRGDNSWQTITAVSAYTSGWFLIEANSSYTVTHNLAKASLIGTIYGAIDASGNSACTIGGSIRENVGQKQGVVFAIANTNSVTVYTGIHNTGAYLGISQGSLAVYAQVHLIGF